MQSTSEINLFGLWAYDTIWALAKAVELVGLEVNYSSDVLKHKTDSKNTDEMFGITVSKAGPRLLQALLPTSFQGLSGKFQLINGHLQPAAYDIINVVRKNETVIRYCWTPNKEAFQDLVQISNAALSGLETQVLHQDWSRHTNEPKISGFSIDVFREKFDAVVGDTTIVGNRTSYVDFTLPYFESGIRMVVKVKDNERKNIWIFLKPLWLTSAGAFIFTGIVIWILEHRINTEFGDGSRKQQLATTLWFSFSTLVFAHEEKVVSNWTRFVLIIWIFVVLILTQSYTASLASLLTGDKLYPAVVDVNELRQTGKYVGYPKDSFVSDLLCQLEFEKTKLKAYASSKEYHEALSKGSKNGGVDAIFDEIPYAFPQGSPLVAHVSRAILNVTQDYKEMEKMQLNYFPDETKCHDAICFLHKYWPALNSIHPEASLLSKLAKCFDRKDSTLFALEQTSQATHVHAASATNARADAASPDARDNMLSNAMSSNQGLHNVTIDDEEDMPIHSMDFGRFSYSCA
ncbi:unnamed protein product [Prunus armeniaca]|uniref:Ionotropic glutamate receptor C-terminal domain-containing protein n=1 Tax=Prunus armeniaca TaxID=36596 RepID=A0A6J5TF38_PRUAR|nr:unnamed protein product [Prunus armeniaca]